MTNAWKYCFWDLPAVDNSLARDLEKLTLLIDRHYEEVRTSEPCSTREVKQV
eukprot:SAG11_NODE_33466_length_277_cov_0.584270_1_plen_51_part_01